MPLPQLKQALVAASATAMLTVATPVVAADINLPSAQAATTLAHQDMTFEHKKHKWKKRHHDDRYYGRGDRYYRSYGEPVYRDTRIWRGRDGQYYCRKENGTTGLLIGAGVGALAGNELAGRGDRTLGAILGAAGGAILGRAIDRSNSRCR